jgi:hypothetical protein
MSKAETDPVKSLNEDVDKFIKLEFPNHVSPNIPNNEFLELLKESIQEVIHEKAIGHGNKAK